MWKMDRCTEYIDDEAIPIQTKKIGYKKCMKKLAAYEDTGLEPDEIRDIKQSYDWQKKRIRQLSDEIIELCELNAKLHNLLDLAMADVSRSCEVCKYGNSTCNCCQYDDDEEDSYEWRYADEVKEMLEEQEEFGNKEREKSVINLGCDCVDSLPSKLLACRKQKLKYDIEVMLEQMHISEAKHYQKLVSERKDVGEVKHARWLINCDGYYPYCSECGEEPQGRAMTKFCPNCGAKMDEGEV